MRALRACISSKSTGTQVLRLNVQLKVACLVLKVTVLCYFLDMQKLTTTKVTILILSPANAPVTALTPASFTSSSAYVTKADGTTTSYSLTGKLSEIDSVNSPGLYLLTIPSTVLDIVGFVSVTLSPAVPGTFVPAIYKDDVGISGVDMDLIRKVLLNNERINQDSATLQILDDNGVDVVLEYYLTDNVGQKSIFNIRNKVKKV